MEVKHGAGKGNGSFTNDRKIHCESNVLSTAHRQKNIYVFDVHVGFE